MTENKKDYQTRCPRLGHLVPFDYCMACGQDRSACWKIFDCWWQQFDVVSYLKQTLSKREFERLTAARPKPKIASLVDILQQVKGR